jgi:GNAT superfamily N-acetyltransferase
MTHRTDLVVLVTDPSHERKGAGRMLLEWGCKKADEAGLPCYLDATKTGRPLYERYGFEMQKISTLDLTQFGGEGEDAVANMIRPAGSGGSKSNGNGKEVDDRGIKAV